MAIGMLYAVIVLLIYNFIQPHPHFIFPKSFTYWASLMYLVIPGSIIAFLCYLELIKNIGPGLAGYTTVLSPIVALLMSAGFEGYTWTILNSIGLVLVIIGNVLVMSKGNLKISKAY